ncbi:hypothetical protein AGMMS49992_13700 [Clostridia bacterium]|nr:hypothetical protein AGMMS49992_13700 [Clostridia bacterium]
MDENERKDDELRDDEAPELPLFSSDVRNLKGDRKGGGKGSRLRGFLWALVVCAVAVGLYFASPYLKPAPKEIAEVDPAATAEPAYLLMDKTKADFVSATVESGGQSYTMTHDGTIFSIEGMPQFKLDQTKASSLCSSLTYLYVNDIEANAVDLSLYGLANPKAKVNVKYTDGTSRNLLLGDEAPSGYRYYFKEEGSPKVYTVYSSTADRYTAALTSMRIIPTWTFADADIQHVKVTHQNGTVVEVKPVEGDVIGISYIELVSPFRYEVDSERIGELYTNAAALKLNGFEADPVAGLTGLYGLDNPRYVLEVYGAPSTQGDVTPTDTQERTLLHLEVGSQKNDSQTFVRILDDQAVYLMDSTLLAFLSNATAPMLVDRFANIINIQKVDTLTITGMGLTEKIDISREPSVNADGSPRLDGNGKQMTDDTFTLNGEPLDDTTARKLYQIIIGTRVDGVIPEGKAPGAAVTPVLTVRYRLNQVRDEETVEYLPYDGDYYAVRRNGETLFYILKTRVQMIPDALNDYHAGTFVPTNYGV